MANSLSTIEDDIALDMRREIQKDKAAFGRLIVSAIRYYNGKRWWFTEAQGTAFNTADGTEYYALPSPLRVIDNVSVTVSQDPYILTKRTNDYLEQVYTPSSVYKGKPSDYAIFNDQIRMFPIPDGVYAVKTQGYGSALPTYSEDPDDAWTTDEATPWANEAYDLIKNRARALAERDWLVNPEGYQMFTIAERDSLRTLMAENNKRSASGKIRAWGIV